MVRVKGKVSRQLTAVDGASPIISLTPRLFSIIVIVAARYFVRFLEIEISDQYLNSLKKHIHEKAPFQEFINVQHTRWFDFRDATDRLQIMRNVSGIVTVTQQAFEV